MAAREQSGKTLDAGFVQRVAAGIRYAISGVTPESWFGPQQPIAPQAQEQTEGRQFDYPVGYNLRIQPREGEAVSFAQLRALADAYDLLRLVIETRKDQVESFDFEILPVDSTKQADAMKGDIDAVCDFLRFPDKQHNWQQWLRQVVEEILVTDALCAYPRATRGAGLYGFELVDGATIKRLIDDSGRTPLPPSPAYQQVLKGIPAANYTSEELVYMPRNPRVWKLYGYSPVEQVITTVNIALRRQMHQLEFYTAGNVPEALVQMPETATPKQVADFQVWWDSVMEGNTAARRKMRFVPSVKGIEYPKKDALKDEMDEWLARIICFAFSVSPTALIRQVNRASGEQMSDTAKEEGLMPLLRFLEGFLTLLIQRHLGKKALRFAWKIVNRVTPEQQALIDKTYIETEVLTPDEVRTNSLNLPEMTPEQRAKAFPLPLPFNQALLGDSSPDDGKANIVPAFQAPGGKDAQPKPGGPKPPQAEPSTAEKALLEAIRLLDPAKLSEAIAKAAESQAPRIVELRPEVHTSIGDVNVHTPKPVVKTELAEAALEKLAESQAALAAALTAKPAEPLAKAAPPAQLIPIRTRRMADGSIVSTPEPPTDATP